ncbi:hypothetical protein DXA38_12350 [[Clostridium] innocuum]|uniref:Uncharacterized protein n=1 Tax=Clostridium innocuum TaxID=1522 RepID=A0A3E2VVS9_CLOIN|nr:hypothetical protein DXA38_12350 [[Clostridium] innocuum]RHV64057.1 hypothetical protein DXB22_11085 [Clostridiaceae bacterium OM02-2AC]
MGALFILNYKRMKEKWQVVILHDSCKHFLSIDHYMLTLQRLQLKPLYRNVNVNAVCIMASCTLSQCSNHKTLIYICIFSHE